MLHCIWGTFPSKSMVFTNCTVFGAFFKMKVWLLYCTACEMSIHINICSNELYEIGACFHTQFGCVLYSTWKCLTLREKRRQRVLRIFRSNRDEVTQEWRKLYNEELNDLYSSPKIVRVIKSRRMRWAGHVACMGEKRGVYRVLVGKPEGKRPLGTPRRRWEDNITMDLQEVECKNMDCIIWLRIGTAGGHL